MKPCMEAAGNLPQIFPVYIQKAVIEGMDNDPVHAAQPSVWVDGSRNWAGHFVLLPEQFGVSSPWGVLLMLPVLCPLPHSPYPYPPTPHPNTLLPVRIGVRMMGVRWDVGIRGKG
jgi:hypothetical protein